MALLAGLGAGLLVVVVSQASYDTDRSSPQGFLSQYLPFGSDAWRTPLDHYDKFINPSRNPRKHGNGPGALSHPRNPAEHSAATDDSYGGKAVLDMDDMPFTNSRDKPLFPIAQAQDFDLSQTAAKEEGAVQKLLATGSNVTPIILSAIGVALLGLVMLGVRIHRGLRPATTLVSSSACGSGPGDNIIEMRPQDSDINGVAAPRTRHLRKDFFGTSRRAALATTLLVPSASVAVPDFLRDVPTESAAEALAPVNVSSRRETEQSLDGRRASTAAQRAVVRAQKAAIGGPDAPTKATSVLKLSVRVARPDGTFYVKPKGEEDPEPPVFADVELELYGSEAPAATAMFLTFAVGDPAAPASATYASALIDERVGDVVYAAKRLRGLAERDVFGERVLVTSKDGTNALSRAGEEVERLLPKETSSMKHDAAGLITRRRTDVGRDLPGFGVTLAPAPSLDATNEVFGRLRPSKGTTALLTALAGLPVYSSAYSGPEGPTSKTETIAEELYRAQNEAFRGAAAAIGDGRAGNVFPGKLLRRVEVTSVKLV
jgi:hypothetical protein